MFMQLTTALETVYSINGYSSIFSSVSGYKCFFSPQNSWKICIQRRQSSLQKIPMENTNSEYWLKFWEIRYMLDIKLEFGFPIAIDTLNIFILVLTDEDTYSHLFDQMQ